MSDPYSARVGAPYNPAPLAAKLTPCARKVVYEIVSQTSAVGRKVRR